MWKSEGLLAEDCGDAAAEWLSTALGTRVRLVRSGDKFHRPMLKPKGPEGVRRPEGVRS